MSDDKKDAVTIGITLSTQIITAALAMIAVVGTFAAFIIDKRDVGIWYYIIVGLSFVCFVSSIICGGKGINQARIDGFSGTWNLTSTKSFFNNQSFLTLIGILLFIVSLFFGKEKVDFDRENILKQNSVLLHIREIDSLNKIQYNSLKSELDSIKTWKQEWQKKYNPNKVVLKKHSNKLKRIANNQK